MLPPFSSSPAPLFAELRPTPADASPLGSLVPAASPEPAAPAVSGGVPSVPIVFADLLAAAAPPAVLPGQTAVPTEPAPDCAAEDAGLDVQSAEPREDSSAAPAGARPLPGRRSLPAPKEAAAEDGAAILMAMGMTAAAPPPPAPLVPSGPEPVSGLSDTPAPALFSDGEHLSGDPLMYRAGNLYSKNNDEVAALLSSDEGESAPPPPTDDSEATFEEAAVFAASPRSAVFAAPISPSASASSPYMRSVGKNNEECPDDKGLVFYEGRDGMEKAKDEGVMNLASANPLFSVASRRGVEAVKVAAPSVDTPSGLATPPSESPSTAAADPILFRAETLPATTPPPAAAVRLVERIDEAAEQLSSRSADHVQISLDLDGSHRVDVKVAMRGGRVFADFRTDSPEMRSALSQAWDGFVRGRDASAQRWAEPVFSSSGTASAAALAPAPAASASSGSFEGDSSAHQDAATDQRHAPRREFPSEENLRSLPTSSSVRTAGAPAVDPAPRADASRLLSALA